MIRCLVGKGKLLYNFDLFSTQSRQGLTGSVYRILKRLVFITLESGTATVALAAANVVVGWQGPDGTVILAVVG